MRRGFIVTLVLLALVMGAGCSTGTGTTPGAPSEPAPTKKELKVGDSVVFQDGVYILREIGDQSDVDYYVATQNGNGLISMERDGRMIDVSSGSSGKVLEIYGTEEIKVRVESGEAQGKQGWTNIVHLSY